MFLRENYAKVCYLWCIETWLWLNLANIICQTETPTQACDIVSSRSATSATNLNFQSFIMIATPQITTVHYGDLKKWSLLWFLTIKDTHFFVVLQLFKTLILSSLLWDWNCVDISCPLSGILFVHNGIDSKNQA